jgi:molybdate transport system substrate-binding protein
MRRAILAVVVAGTVAMPARADDIHVLSAAAMQTVFKEVAADFARTSGHRRVITYATMGAIGERVAKGEKPELVIGSSASMAKLVADGKVDPASARAIAKVGVGIAVPADDGPLPGELQDYTGVTAGILTGPVVAAALGERGMEPY